MKKSTKDMGRQQRAKASSTMAKHGYKPLMGPPTKMGKGSSALDMADRMGMAAGGVAKKRKGYPRT